MLSLGAIFRPRCLFRIQGMLIIQSFENAKTNQDNGSSTRSSNPPKRFKRWESRSAFNGCQNILIVTERPDHSIGQGRRLQSKIDLFSPLLIRERAQPAPIKSSPSRSKNGDQPPSLVNLRKIDNNPPATCTKNPILPRTSSLTTIFNPSSYQKCVGFSIP